MLGKSPLLLGNLGFTNSLLGWGKPSIYKNLALIKVAVDNSMNIRMEAMPEQAPL